MKQIVNKVKTCDFIDRNELKEFQWDLKKQDNKDLISQLCERIKKTWFSAPIFVWEWTNYILDWHQRFKALTQLSKQWFQFENDKIPCILIEAKTEEEAREKVLEYNSAYSEWNIEVLTEWNENLDTEFINIKEFDQIDYDNEESSDNNLNDLWDSIKEEYQLLITCENEIEQWEIYDLLLERNLKVKVL